MDWNFWFTWWFLFHSRHPSLFRIYHQKTQNFKRKSSSSNLCEKNKNRIPFKIKTGYRLELLTPETMRLLGGIKRDVDKDKDGENVPELESVEVALVHCK